MAEENQEKLFDSLLDIAQLARNDINREFLKKKLNVKPIKDKYYTFETCFQWQADLLVLPPNRSRIQYVLVCVDTATRKCDAEPLTYLADLRQAINENSRDFANTISHATLIAYGEILERQIICTQPPKLLYVDGGVEFQGAFARAVSRGGATKIRTTVRGRKQQNAIVEHTNALLKFGLMSNLYRLRTEGLPHNAPPRDIAQINIFSQNILPRLVAKINEWAEKKFPLPVKAFFNFDFNYPETDVKVGQLVYIPKLYTERIRQRSGQHSFLKTPFVVTKVYTPTLKGQPYRFETSFSSKVTFKRDEIIKAQDYVHNAPIIEFG